MAQTLHLVEALAGALLRSDLLVALLVSWVALVALEQATQVQPLGLLPSVLALVAEEAAQPQVVQEAQVAFPPLAVAVVVPGQLTQAQVVQELPEWP